MKNENDTRHEKTSRHSKHALTLATVIKSTQNNLKQIFSRLILTTTVEDERDWWNGVYVLVLEK